MRCEGVLLSYPYTYTRARAQTSSPGVERRLFARIDSDKAWREFGTRQCYIHTYTLLRFQLSREKERERVLERPKSRSGRGSEQARDAVRLISRGERVRALIKVIRCARRNRERPDAQTCFSLFRRGKESWWVGWCVYAYICMHVENMKVKE